MNTKNCSINTRLAKGVKLGVNPPKSPVSKALETRPVQILIDPPDSAQTLADWGFWLAEVTAYTPWSQGSSQLADQAIALREGGQEVA